MRIDINAPVGTQVLRTGPRAFDVLLPAQVPIIAPGPVPDPAPPAPPEPPTADTATPDDDNDEPTEAEIIAAINATPIPVGLEV